ncbi:MAG: hypothetical protein AAGJ82_00415 [Bacteroidota bacterium]
MKKIFLFLLGITALLFYGCDWFTSPSPSNTLSPSYGAVLPAAALEEVVFTWPAERLPEGDQPTFELYALDTVLDVGAFTNRYQLKKVYSKALGKDRTLALKPTSEVTLSAGKSYLWQLTNANTSDKTPCLRTGQYATFSVVNPDPQITVPTSPFGSRSSGPPPVIDPGETPYLDDQLDTNNIQAIHTVNGKLVFNRFKILANRGNNRNCVTPDANDSVHVSAELKIEVPCDSLGSLAPLDTLIAYVFDSLANRRINTKFVHHRGLSTDRSVTAHLVEIRPTDYHEVVDKNCKKQCLASIRYDVSFAGIRPPSTTAAHAKQYYFGAYLGFRSQHPSSASPGTSHASAHGLTHPFDLQTINFTQFKALSGGILGTFRPQNHLQEHMLLLGIPVCTQ